MTGTRLQEGKRGDFPLVKGVGEKKAREKTTRRGALRAGLGVEKKIEGLGGGKIAESRRP